MQVAKRSTDFTVAIPRKFTFIFEPQNSTKTTNWTWDVLSFSLFLVCFFFSLIVAFQVLPQFARCRSIFCLNFLDLFCSFFVIFSGFFSFHHFFFFIFTFFRLSHLLWSFECGNFSILFCFFYFLLPSLCFSSCFSWFVSIFIFSKKIICFIFIFRGDRLSNGFAQKASARVFLQKLQRRRGTTENNQHIFSIFLAFLFILYVYICVHHILKLLFYHFI